jgi:hypothetical protein
LTVSKKSRAIKIDASSSSSCKNCNVAQNINILIVINMKLGILVYHDQLQLWGGAIAQLVRTPTVTPEVPGSMLGNTLGIFSVSHIPRGLLVWNQGNPCMYQCYILGMYKNQGSYSIRAYGLVPGLPCIS